MRIYYLFSGMTTSLRRRMIMINSFLMKSRTRPTNNNRQSPYMKDGVCSKRYPKPFCDQTHASDKGFPEYRRRYYGRTVSKKGVKLDNRHVKTVVSFRAFRALSEIDHFLRLATPPKDRTCYPNMPQLADYPHVQEYPINDGTNSLIAAERNYSASVLDNTLAAVDLLNEDKRRVFDLLKIALDSTHNSCIYASSR